MNDICPNCLQDMKLDTDFMVNNDMFEVDNQGIIKCPLCDEKIKWTSYQVIEHDFEIADDE